jgi:AraC family transcriptional regulator of adaptative response/methylated-DNA-[protein]-cysteine methyltransferase
MDQHPHFHLVARALQWVSDNRMEQPDLGRLAQALEVSPHHLQRVFQAWAGVSPKQFLKFLTRQAALERLAAGESVLDASISAGLSGPGRLHDLMISTVALSPGEIRKRGEGAALSYGFGQTPFGDALVSWSDRGVSFLGFCDEVSRPVALANLTRQWRNASFSHEPTEARTLMERIFQRDTRGPLPLWLRGSPFQLKVWEALLAVPEGTHATYGRIARLIGKPSASRAVGSAIGTNPVAWLIPCHRIIRSLGEFGGYRWGGTTKQAMIGFESARLAVSHLPERDRQKAPSSGDGLPGNP